MPSLRLEQVGKVYGGGSPTTVLTGVDLEIAQGDFVAITGPSGGGKSTLLNIIGLLDEPTSGSYLIDHLGTGRLDTRRAGARRLAQERSDTLAFVFQAFHLLDRRPVVDSVELGLLYRGLPARERRRLALNALESVNIAHLARHSAGTLSGGERQRVAIARALAAGAPVVVADEPTGNLDSANGRAVIKALVSLNARGSTVVLVTHSAETAAAASRRIALRDGRVLSESGSSRARTDSPPPAPPGRPSRVRARDVFFDALASLRSRVGRAGALIVAVALAVALALSTIGITASASAQVADTFNAHTNRDVSVSWRAGALTDERDLKQAGIITALGALAGAHATSIVSDYGSTQLRANQARSGYEVPVYGVSGDYVAASRSTVRWAPRHPHVLTSGEVLIGDTAAKQIALGPLVGSPVVSVGGVPTEVAGLITASPRVADARGAIVLPDADAVTSAPAGVRRALIVTSSGAAQQVARQAPYVIDPFRPEALDVSAPRDPTSLRARVQGEVQITLALFTGVALLAALVGLANASVLAVLERRQEFGLRRAVGARAGHIFALVLSESSMLGMIGGCLGLALGMGTVLVVTVLNHWAPVFDVRMAPLAVLGGIVVGALGGLVASVRAARIRPNDALRA